MKKSSTVFKVGTRKSKLALAQTTSAIASLKRLFPTIDFVISPCLTPGDRDRKKDLRISEGDFFTRDLDDNLINGTIDCALHSAKDLQEQLRNGIDYCYLPWYEDPRDVIVLRENESLTTTAIARIGVSSDRRCQYCEEHFPNAKLIPIRGNIEERIAQLDAGCFDLLIMAAAGLKRLDLDNRISEYIALDNLRPPSGQGYLALTFRVGDPFFTTLRKLFITPVVIAGAGCGEKNMTTDAVLKSLQSCDLCLYDDLVPKGVIDQIPDTAVAIAVGKREGLHSAKQHDICNLMTTLCREGKKVLRLKGGDPTVFGRLGEEIAALEAFSLPYRVLPGISALSIATASTGLLLTRRGVSRGFTVMTPRKAGSSSFVPVKPQERLSFPIAIFMGTSKLQQLSLQLISEGRSPDEPATVIFGAGTPNMRVVSSNLQNISIACTDTNRDNLPGLVLIGKNTDSKFLFTDNSLLRGSRVLLTCSRHIMEKASSAVLDYGGVAIEMPFIETRLRSDSSNIVSDIEHYNYLLLTSPAAVAHTIAALKATEKDIRSLPKLILCGPGSAKALIKSGIYPELVAKEKFGTEGVVAETVNSLPAGENILYLHSDRTDTSLSEKLRQNGFTVDDRILYDTLSVSCKGKCKFDVALFASSSAVESFISDQGVEALTGKTVSVIGKPTEKTLKSYNCRCRIVVSERATVADAIYRLALDEARIQITKIVCRESIL